MTSKLIYRRPLRGLKGRSGHWRMKDRVITVSNRLANEKSPYLLQHAHNPVDWHPWDETAFEKARQEDKPIFLSIGYATCHWCHVMAHESFEDEEVAELLNEHYVSIKVDREERPDIDQVYMGACQALTGQGGWPLSAFITPDGRPFYVGTYFPKNSRYGRPGFIELLKMMADKYQSEREMVLKAADQLVQALKNQPGSETGGAPGLDHLRSGYQQLIGRYDRKWAGFGPAPKFPTPHYLNFLLRWYHRQGGQIALEAVEKTLTAMARGGIYDQIGYGFHRYSVDEEWLVPHFEKMLYDQALLAVAYLEAFQVTGNDRYADTAREIFTYVLRDMTAPEGGFYSAEDADSEGREGVYYTWRPEQIREELGETFGDLFCRFYGVTPEGNFEDGLSILHETRDRSEFARENGLDPDDFHNRLEQGGKQLLRLRENRIRPERDEKILTGWNGLMIAALAKGGQILGDDGFTRAAERSADFIRSRLKSENGRLFRRYCRDEAGISGFVEDYAFLAWGLIELYETTFKADYLEDAVDLTAVMLDLFWDDQDGGLYFSGQDNEALIHRKKEVYDGAIPSANSVAALNLLRLGRMTGRADFEEKADGILKAFSKEAGAIPMAHTNFLMAVDYYLGPGREIVISGNMENDSTKALIEEVHRRFLPHKVMLLHSGEEDGGRIGRLAPFIKEMKAVDDRPTFYLCQDFVCHKPVTDPASVANMLDAD